MKSPKKQAQRTSISYFPTIILCGLVVTIFGATGIKAKIGWVGRNALAVSNSARHLRQSEQSISAGTARSTSNCDQPSFGNLLPFSPTSTPSAGPPRIAVGDFNGDSLPDVALTGRSDFASVQIMLGDGRGNFREASGSPFPAGRFPNQLVTADLNRDGKDDLLIADAVAAGEVKIYLSDGAGNLHAASVPSLAVVINPVSLAVARFNGGGELDFVIGHADLPWASICLGDGTGSFSRFAQPPITATGEVTVRAEDFNRDGKADFAVVDLGSGMVTVQLGDGVGNFTPALGSPFLGTQFATSFVIADFNRDGTEDLALTNSVASTVKIWLGQGLGGFHSGDTFSVANRPVTIEADDFNGDGKPDIAVATERSGSSVLLGDGDGGFFGRTDWPEGGALAVKDINLDGKPDLVFAGGVRLNTCSSGCDQPSFDAPLSFATGANPYHVASGDFNRDGTPDLAVTNSGAGSLTILLGNGAGNFSVGPSSPLTAGNGVQSIVTGDFNGDAILDLALGRFLAFPNGAMTHLLGQGNGHFAPLSSYDARWGVASLAVGDFNRDGRQDLAMGLADTNLVPILLGTSDGLYGLHDPAQVDFGEGTFFLATGEFNGDGKLDLVVTNGGADETHISVLLGDGTGGFNAPTRYSVGGTGAIPNWVVVADFNRDGKADVATANFGDDTISVLLGNGAGGFNAPLRFGVQGGVAMIAAADFNQDGKLDLATRYRRQGIAGNFGLFLGKGDGSFGGQLNYFQGEFPFFLGTADINRDGKPDLITTNFSANTVSVLLNSCAPTTADLRLAKTAFPEQLLAGSNVTWTIKVTNQGPGEARGIVVNDTLSNGMAIVACEATDGGVCGGTGNNRTITFPALESGTEAIIKLTARIGCEVPDGTSITNTATVNAATPDPELPNNSARARTLVVNPSPKIKNVSVDKPVLWPPNHKLVDVQVHYKATDRCGAVDVVNCQLRLTSNELVDPLYPDWVIVDAHHVKLRAEREGKGHGRVYTIIITCRDRAGGVDIATTTVKVPISPGK